MNEIKCIAIDDEPIALKQIVANIEKTPFLDLIGSFDNAIDALNFIEQNETDLMFVDINMPDLNGIDFVKSLNDGPRIIFTTAYSKYAIEGFRVDAIDYLLKPISYVEFLKSANKAQKLFKLLKKETDKVQVKDDFLFIKSEGKVIRVNCKDIKYIEGMREYVRIHLINDKPVMTLLSMKNLEKFLPKTYFMRVHRSYIVNLVKISAIERSRIIFDQKEYIPVSEQYKKQFQEYLNKNSL